MISLAKPVLPDESQKLGIYDYLSSTRGSFVYFLIDGSSVAYIGRTRSLKRRLRWHASHKKFSSVYYMCVPEYAIAAKEKEMIRRYRPPLNSILFKPRICRRRASLYSDNKAPRKNLTMPADWWQAFEAEAEKHGISLSAWIGRACLKQLPAVVRKSLSARNERGRPST